MIHYISPYSTEKNIGGAINLAIEQLNANMGDWIVHLDHDAMFLLPDSKMQLEEILNTTNYDILGPVTNRLGVIGQVMYPMFEERDILKHIQYAQQLQDKKWGAVVPTKRVLAAFCLCFRVGLWQSLGGFEENIQFDSKFCAKVLILGGKLGIMPGLYVFHTYRMGKDVKDYSHLI